MYSYHLSAAYSVHIILLIFKGIINHYIRKTVLSGVRFMQVTVMRFKLRTKILYYVYIKKKNSKVNISNRT